MGFSQNSLGEIDSFVQLGDLLPESIDLGQELRILRRLRPPSEAVGQRPPHRTDGEKEEGSSSEDQNYCEYPFYIHASRSPWIQARTFDPACTTGGP